MVSLILSHQRLRFHNGGEEYKTNLDCELFQLIHHSVLLFFSRGKTFSLIISIIFHIPKIGDYLKILSDDEVTDFVVINFGEYFKSARVKLYSKLNGEQNLGKVAELF